MPHIIIEFSADLAFDEAVEVMLDTVHQAIAETGLFDESHIRIRAVPLQHYRVGGNKQHFVHAQLRIHGGRTDEQKHTLSQEVLAALKAQPWQPSSITVEVVELHKPSYAKYKAANI